MIPMMLIGAIVLGASLIFGFTSFIVGFILMLAGVLGLFAFMATPGAVLRPGEREFVEERHYMGKHDDEDYRYHR
ncbi:hypothetical protein [Streptomyces poonensis]|uniref:Uncharacterized protein n=1 Tax=Streptomyces poonensis TaxID=68255 RepID=A0A918PSI5_9ACTN|nr:hypothetical protein [Streptomyces poonensis]GGZ19767.1 hypothetical protein GCM10010365_45040 [Streptomyces poonensis]